MNKMVLIAIGVAGVAGLLLLFFTLPLLWSLSIVGIMLGLFVSIIVFALLAPVFIGMGLLVNKPEDRNPSGFHLFTLPEEGKVKIVVRGDRVIRMIMLYAGHRFKREGDKEQSKYWQIVKSDTNEDPLAGIWWPLLPWAHYVYGITGAVFTGIYPFQTVHEYMLERTKMNRDEDGDPTSKNAGKPGGNNIVLHVKEDISDHFRARQFLYPFRVSAADTKDKISVNILVVIKAHVTNPHKAAYGTDRWDLQLVNLATNALTNYTRTHNLEDVLSAQDAVQARGLNEAIKEIKHDEKQYGIEIDGVDIIDISPNLSPEEKSDLYAEALAKTKGKATIIDGESRAAALKAINEANEAGGEYAVETLRTEALVRAAEAAKGGTVLLPIGGGAHSDPTQAAILAELKKLNKGSGDTA